MFEAQTLSLTTLVETLRPYYQLLLAILVSQMMNFLKIMKLNVLYKKVLYSILSYLCAERYNLVFLGTHFICMIFYVESEFLK